MYSGSGETLSVYSVQETTRRSADGQRTPLVASVVNSVPVPAAKLTIASPVVSVVPVPTSAFVRLYLQLKPGPFSTYVIACASTLHFPPRIWNSSSFMIEVERMHHGVPLVPMFVSRVKLPKMPVQAPLAPVPVKVKASMLPSTFEPSFLVSSPVNVDDVHAVQTSPLLGDTNVMFPRLWPSINLPVASRVPVGCVASGEFAAEANAGKANTARANTARQAVMSFLLMGYFLSLMPSLAGR